MGNWEKDWEVLPTQWPAAPLDSARQAKLTGARGSCSQVLLGEHGQAGGPAWGVPPEWEQPTPWAGPCTQEGQTHPAPQDQGPLVV
jgi:hypothetical protein